MPPIAHRVLRSRLRNWLATAIVAGATAVAVALAWQYYVLAPWTRDGRVRVLVANVAPQVTGQIVELHISDNQIVHKGDVLYVIDPFDFRVAVNAAEAEVENREADVQVKGAQAARRQALTTVSTSVEEKQQFLGTAKIADAALKTARARLAQARINLRRTEVRSPVDGFVTNMQLRVGDYATAGTVSLSVIDRHSFWVDGYFEETKLARICAGDTASIELMGFGQPIPGRVESFGRGIAVSNATPGTQGLPGVDPVYTWVRLAQRVPVRVRIGDVPPGVLLASGLTATVRIRGDRDPRGAGTHRPGEWALALDMLGLRPAAPRACDLPDNVDTSPVSRLPYDEGAALLPAAMSARVPALPLGEATGAPSAEPLMTQARRGSIR